MRILLRSLVCFLPFAVFAAVSLAADGPSSGEKGKNPIIWADVPDISIARAGDTYYMSSTTMHMAPGLPIMKSKNLVDWEMVSYGYDILEDIDASALRNGKSCYGAGTWASSMRFHEGKFYCSTFANTSGKTHIYTTGNIESEPWKEIKFSPAIHDHSLFFDDDGKVYMMHGVGDIRLTELKEDLSGIKPGGFAEVVVPKLYSVGSRVRCLAEGSQLFKIYGRYYLVNIIWPPNDMRTVTVYRADKITGPYEGKVVLKDAGIAQGGLVDTPDGKWYAYLFQDCGAVGRIPFLVPVKWEDGWPVLGTEGKVPMSLDITKETPGLGNIVESDEFERSEELLAKLKSLPNEENAYLREAFPLAWQWNHNPDNRFWSLTQRPSWLRLSTGRVDKKFVDARNSLTQRTFGPESSAATLLDTSGMKEGDIAGIAVLQKKYGLVGVKFENGTKSIIMLDTDNEGREFILESTPLEGDTVYLKIDCDFKERIDEARFYWSADGEKWERLGGVLKMAYTLPHFMGYRFALFNFATKNSGGHADFDFYRIASEIGK